MSTLSNLFRAPWVPLAPHKCERERERAHSAPNGAFSCRPKLTAIIFSSIRERTFPVEDIEGISFADRTLDP